MNGKRMQIEKLNPTVYKNPGKLNEVLGAVYREISDALGSRLVGMKLFGSYARGDCWEESDIDLFVILEDGVDGWTGEVHDILLDISYEYGLENDVLISVIRTNRTPYAEDRLNPLYMNVRAEGIDIGRDGLVV
ncbi:MAG: nucleotidyltransferase domain-containing protein [Clostridia bacterium]|nr:nucleotidyltransferase domain-containing protein [Clostridia bacterium]